MKKHKLNESGKTYDLSPERQDKALEVLIDDTKRILRLCEEHNRPMPTEIKMVYDVRTKHLDANYRYDLIHSTDPRRTAKMVADEWYAQIELQGC